MGRKVESIDLKSADAVCIDEKFNRPSMEELFDGVSHQSRVGLQTYLVLKRLLDIVVSAAIILFSSPLMLFIFVYIRMKSDGPVVFRHTRMKRDRRNRKTRVALYFKHPSTGEMLPERRVKADAFLESAEDVRKNGCEQFYRDWQSRDLKKSNRQFDLRGEPFKFTKFATMYHDAKERFPELYAYKYSNEEIGKMRFKQEGDPRVPPWARWLRKSSMDELPNFIHVLKGDMSLVGPRPDIPEMLQYYTEHQQAVKLSVKPGVTGLPQIKGRGDLTFQETLDLDMEYVRKRSFTYDLHILYQTFVKLFNGRESAY